MATNNRTHVNGRAPVRQVIYNAGDSVKLYQNGGSDIWVQGVLEKDFLRGDHNMTFRVGEVSRAGFARGYRKAIRYKTADQCCIAVGRNKHERV